MVADHLFNTDTLVTCILHDVIEDTNLTKDLIQQIFDPMIAEQVKNLTRIKLDKKISVSNQITLLCSQKKRRSITH